MYVEGEGGSRLGALGLTWGLCRVRFRALEGVFFSFICAFRKLIVSR